MVPVLLALTDPVDLDQRPVQRQVRPLVAFRLFEYFVQVRAMPGDHVDRLVQVAVSGRDRQAGFRGEQSDRGVVAKPAQHHFRLHADRPRTAAGAGPDLVTVRAQQCGHMQQSLLGHVADGRVAEHVGSS